MSLSLCSHSWLEDTLMQVLSCCKTNTTEFQPHQPSGVTQLSLCLSAIVITLLGNHHNMVMACQYTAGRSQGQTFSSNLQDFFCKAPLCWVAEETEIFFRKQYLHVSLKKEKRENKSLSLLCKHKRGLQLQSWIFQPSEWVLFCICSFSLFPQSLRQSFRG